MHGQQYIKIATLISKNNLTKFVHELFPVRLSDTLLAQFITHLFLFRIYNPNYDWGQHKPILYQVM
jgi:hypothetical protein